MSNSLFYYFDSNHNLINWLKSFCIFFTFSCLTIKSYLNPFSVTFNGWNFLVGYFSTNSRMINLENKSNNEILLDWNPLSSIPYFQKAWENYESFSIHKHTSSLIQPCGKIPRILIFWGPSYNVWYYLYTLHHLPTCTKKPLLWRLTLKIKCER